MNDSPLTRRTFIRTALGATAVIATGLPSQAQERDLPPTPGNPQGPYYKAGAPFRNQLFDDDEPGDWLYVSGRVVTTTGKPIPRGLLDVWQCDDGGVYDNTSPEYRGRGRLFTDKQGNYWFRTIWPGHYPGRTAHIHVKVSHPRGFQALTTQLYFKGDPLNDNDGSYLPELEMDPVLIDGTYYGTFQFVLAKL